MSDFFATLNQYFDQVYVLTLERAHGRHQAIQQALHGLEYRFFFSADKLTLNIPQLILSGDYNDELACKNQRYGKPMQPGQLGCAIGHRMIYEDILRKGYRRVLILEDDVEPIPDMERSFHAVLKELPESWELLYLDYNKNIEPHTCKQAWYHIQRAVGMLRWSHTTISNLYPRKISDHISTAGFHDYTSAYALTHAGAVTLLRLQTPVSYVADNLLAKAATEKWVKAYIAKPKIFRQRSQGQDASEASMVSS